MSNTDKELDELLDEYIVPFSTLARGKYIKEDLKKTLQALIHRHQNQLLDKLLEEVIGEDEAFQAEPSDKWEYASLVGQNKLRATQREAINKLRSDK